MGSSCSAFVDACKRFLRHREPSTRALLPFLLFVTIAAVPANAASPCVPERVASPLEGPCTIGDLTFILPYPASESTASRHTSASSYTITDLGTLGGTESFAYAINDPGQIVGKSRLPGDTSTHDFLYRKGELTDLSPLDSGNIQTGWPTGINDDGLIASGVVVGGIYYPALFDSMTGEITLLGSFGGLFFGEFTGVATSVNKYGQAAGYSYLDSLNRHAFLYSDGVMTDIGSFGGYSFALGINDFGTIVGTSSELVNGVGHAFIYSQGAMTEINPFGSLRNESSARGINNRGQVVGEALTNAGNGFRGFVYRAGTITDVGTLDGGRNSYAFALNERGQVVGIADRPYVSTCWDPIGGYVPCTRYIQRAVLYDNSELKDLNSLIPADSGWDLSWAFGINNRGQIIGYGLYKDRFRAFVLTPVR